MIIRSFFYFMGLFIISFGVSLMIKADLGTGAWDAVNVGLSKMIGLTIGTWVFIVGLLLIAFNAVFGKKRPEYLAVFSIFFIGFVVDFWLTLIFKDWVPVALMERSMSLIGGIIVVAAGVGMYLQPRFPLIPVDTLMLQLQERFGLKLSSAKTIAEVTALLIALCLNGPIGIGTILFTLGMGPLIQLFNWNFAKLYKRLLGNS